MTRARRALCFQDTHDAFFGRVALFQFAVAESCHAEEQRLIVATPVEGRELQAAGRTDARGAEFEELPDQMFSVCLETRERDPGQVRCKKLEGSEQTLSIRDGDQPNEPVERCGPQVGVVFQHDGPLRAGACDDSRSASQCGTHFGFGAFARDLGCGFRGDRSPRPTFLGR